MIGNVIIPGYGNGFTFLPTEIGGYSTSPDFPVAPYALWDGVTYYSANDNEFVRSNKSDVRTPVCGPGTPYVGPLTLFEAVNWFYRVKSWIATSLPVITSTTTGLKINSGVTQADLVTADPSDDVSWANPKHDCEAFLATNNAKRRGFSYGALDSKNTDTDQTGIPPIEWVFSQAGVGFPFAWEVAHIPGDIQNNYFVDLTGMQIKAGSSDFAEGMPDPGNDGDTINFSKTATSTLSPNREANVDTFTTFPVTALDADLVGPDSPYADTVVIDRISGTLKITLPGTGRVLSVPLFGFFDNNALDGSVVATIGADAVLEVKPEIWWEYGGTYDKDTGALVG